MQEKAKQFILAALQSAPAARKAVLFELVAENAIVKPAAMALARQVAAECEIWPLTDFCAAYNALFLFDKTLLTGRHLATLTQRLIASEVASGGPYAEASGPTLVLNLAVARFAKLQGGELPKVSAFLARQITARTSLFTYWRLQKLGIANAAQVFDVRLAKLPATSSLRLALQVQPLTAAEVKTLQARQQSNGSWRGEAGFSTEFLTMLLHQKLHTSAGTPPKQTASVGLFSEMVAVLQAISPELAKAATKPLQQLHSADSEGEMSQFASVFNACLPVPASSAFCNRLGLANLWAWLAYTLYDDLLDGDNGPQFLPLANIAHRQALELYRRYTSSGFYEFALQTFSAMDVANHWELTHCRFNGQTITEKQLPEYDKNQLFARRAGAHNLGPLALLAEIGWSLNGRQFQAVKTGLDHYLIARQLNDDLHDWKKDLAAGHLSHTTVALLKNHLQPGKTYYVSHMLPELECQFWETTLASECRLVLAHIRQARWLLSQHLQLAGPFAGFLGTIENTATSALSTWQQQREFAESYASTSKK